MNRPIFLILTASIFALTACDRGGGSSAAKKGVSGNANAPSLSEINQKFSGDTLAIWDYKSSNNDWSSFVSSELDSKGTDLLDVVIADDETFCPNYKNLNLDQRKEFWVFLISAMSYFESTLNASATNPEDASPSDTKIPRGLLQLSPFSVNDYGCQIGYPTELHDPHTSLSCGVRMLNKLVAQDGRIGGKVNGKWKGGARYWSVLREGNKRNYRHIISWTSNLEICK